ncbi:MAG: Type 1 glutamine amidotransferase-like domain-containing protein [Clostridia bacterium]|nr:Type 1 glutamine amidotransferase-like domain-containing protein [Clostridia bacterium]
MKHIFLTSDIGAYKKINGEKVVCAFNNANGLVDQIKQKISSKEVFVFVASNPSGFEKTDSYANVIFNSFLMSGFNLKKCIVVDDRNKENLQLLLNSAAIVYLAGGHVPTQNEFIKNINLKNLLANYDGVILGQSAGSMNLSKVVYNYPEDISELADPKFLEGLALTNLTIVPHFNKEKGNEQVDDGIDLMNDYLLKDSYKLPLYCLTNGAHIYVNDDCFQVYGDAYLMQNGNITKLENEKVFEK